MGKYIYFSTLRPAGGKVGIEASQISSFYTNPSAIDTSTVIVTPHAKWEVEGNVDYIMEMLQTFYGEMFDCTPAPPEDSSDG